MRPIQEGASVPKRSWLARPDWRFLIVLALSMLAMAKFHLSTWPGIAISAALAVMVYGTWYLVSRHLSSKPSKRDP
jgi:hypothetical protein